MYDWIVRKLFPRPYFSGNRIENRVFRALRFITNRPYKVGSLVEIIEPKGCEHWKREKPGPLVVLGYEWIPPKWKLTPGFLYRMRDRNGVEHTMHEQYIVGALRSSVEKMRDGTDGRLVLGLLGRTTSHSGEASGGHDNSRPNRPTDYAGSGNCAGGNAPAKAPGRPQELRDPVLPGVYDGYGWIKVKRWKHDPDKTAEENYEALHKHHLEETTFLIDEIRRLAATPKSE